MLRNSSLGSAIAAALLVAACSGGGGTAPPPHQAAFSPTGALHVARSDHAAARLSDGKVLVAGGTGAGACASAEIYDPAAGTFASAPTLLACRSYPAVAALPGRRALLVGDAGTAEVYDGGTGSFAPAGTMTPRIRLAATALAGGDAIVTGGYQTGSVAVALVERYGAGTGSVTSAGALAVPRGDHTATLLATGKILVAGGSPDGSTGLASAELYDPATSTSAATGALASARLGHTATLLPSGKVLIAGGAASTAVLASAELYDPASGTFAATGAMAEARYAHVAALLPDGRVLVAGGYDFTRVSDNDGILASSELYDPASGTFSPGPPMGTRRAFTAAAVLPDGGVLVAGGLRDWTGAAGELSTAEVFR